jgi:thiamine biosynthesis lipoprotein
MPHSLKRPAMTRRRFLLALGAAGASTAAGRMLWSSGKDAPAPQGELEGLRTVHRTGFVLGAELSITALHEDIAMADDAVKAAFKELEVVESVMSLYRPQSQLCRLNRDGVLHEPHPYLVRVLQKAQALSVASAGDFDVTVQPLWTLYSRCRRNGSLPTADDLEDARRLVDWRRVDVRQDHIHLKGRGTSVTLNGIAQGFAADRVLEALKAGGVRHALVNTGEIGAMGRRPGGGLWTVGIQHPRRQNEYVSRTALDGRCVATSGDYGTAFSHDGVHHHIFDPRTGRSPTAFQSVTVLAKTGLEADALSTAVFVTGLERGIKLIESAPGADALFVMKSGETKGTRGFPAEA